MREGKSKDLSFCGMALQMKAISEPSPFRSCRPLAFVGLVVEVQLIGHLCINY